MVYSTGRVGCAGYFNALGDTVMIISFQTDWSGQTVQTLQTVQTKIKGFHCLLFHLHLFHRIP